MTVRASFDWEDKLKQRLEFLGHIVMILVGVVWLYIMGVNYVMPTLLARSTLGVGQKLPAVAGVTWVGRDRTILVAMRIGCRPCQDSIPFYKKLATVVDDRTRIVLLFGESPERVRNYSATEGLNLQTIAEAPIRALGVSGTPTLILVDGSGTVVKTWTGFLSPTGQQEVIAIVSNRSGT
jgi:hypothetical protein